MPRQYLNYMGIANSEEESHAPDRATFAAYFEDVMRVVTAVAPLDRAADYMAQELAHVRLPPLLTRAQRKQQYACAENNPLGEGTVQGDMEERGRGGALQGLQGGSSSSSGGGGGGGGGVSSTPVQLSLGRAGKQRLRQKASATKSAKKMKKKLMKKTGGKMDTEECAALDVLQAEAAADGEDALLPLEVSVVEGCYLIYSHVSYSHVSYSHVFIFPCIIFSCVIFSCAILPCVTLPGVDGGLHGASRGGGVCPYLTVRGYDPRLPHDA